jgi:REP element-mobilizing transposase RayT
MKKTRIPDSGYKELRKGRYSQRGAFYFVTTCCYNKENFFLNKENIHILSDSIDWLENKKYMDLYFYIAMPNHVHLVF